jgi:hypothetical protein
MVVRRLVLGSTPPREVFPTELTSDEEMERGTSTKMDDCKQNSSVTEL